VKSLSPSVRRLIAVALLVAAVALPYRLIVQPLLQSYDERADAAATQHDLLARYRNLANSRAQLRARLQEIQAEPSSQAGYLTGESETLVAAELQNLVRTTVERNGGRLESTQILAPVSEGAFRRVALRVRMSTDTDGLFRILYDVESTLPYLFLDGLDIASRERRARRSISGPEGSALSVGYDVYGYMRSG
jgi:general secretion pathway protein M